MEFRLEVFERRLPAVVSSGELAQDVLRRLIRDALGPGESLRSSTIVASLTNEYDAYRTSTSNRICSVWFNGPRWAARRLPPRRNQHHRLESLPMTEVSALPRLNRDHPYGLMPRLLEDVALGRQTMWSSSSLVARAR